MYENQKQTHAKIKLTPNVTTVSATWSQTTSHSPLAKLPSTTAAPAIMTLPSSNPMRFQLPAALLVFAPLEGELVPELAPDVGDPDPERGTEDGVKVDAGVAFRQDWAAASAEALVGGAEGLTVALPLKLHYWRRENNEE